MVSSSFYWTHFLELMLKLSGTEHLMISLEQGVLRLQAGTNSHQAQGSLG